MRTSALCCSYGFLIYIFANKVYVQDKQWRNTYTVGCIVYAICLYFSQDVNSTTSVIKTKWNSRFTQECICTEAGSVVRAQSQQMQKSSLNPGIPSLVALCKFRERFCQDSGSGKTSGIIQDPLHSWFRKENKMPWYHFFCIKQIGEGEKSEYINVLDMTFAISGIQNTGGALVLWQNKCIICLLPRSKLQKLFNYIRKSYRTL